MTAQYSHRFSPPHVEAGVASALDVVLPQPLEFHFIQRALLQAELPNAETSGL